MAHEDFSAHFEVMHGIEGIGVFAIHDIPANAVIFTMEGPVLIQPTRTSVQIGEHEHIEDEIAGHVNHSCHPNAMVNRAARTFVSLRKIIKGEEITFDYRENEDRLASPFVCQCCQKNITGKKLQIS